MTRRRLDTRLSETTTLLGPGSEFRIHRKSRLQRLDWQPDANKALLDASVDKVGLKAFLDLNKIPKKLANDRLNTLKKDKEMQVCKVCGGY